ncbi:MAG: chitobiase/beta-hexosaminidase C-terminal domain-containing protein [Gemmataceae bacterium]
MRAKPTIMSLAAAVMLSGVLAAYWIGPAHASRPTSKPFLNLPAGRTFPALLSQTGAFTDTRTLQPAQELIPYEINYSFWSDGALKKRWMALPVGHIHPSPTGEWDFPVGTVFVKHFERNNDQPLRIETRLLVHDGMGVYGASYRWRSDQSDAELVREPQRDQWYFPGPDDCVKCHTCIAGGVLGVNTRQINRTDAQGVNQLRHWQRLELFDTDLGDPKELPRLAGCDSDRVEDRARSMLDVNCGYCHRPGGAETDFDARYDTPLPQQKLVSAPARINLGLDHARLIAPNDPWRSLMLVRMETLEGTKMPPLGHENLDRESAKLLREWICSMPGPPVVAPPIFAVRSCEFRGSLNVTLTHPDKAAVLRLTLDGSAPNDDSQLYQGPLRVEDSKTIRARAFKPGHTRSIVVQETYVKEQ